jgi:2-methylcitrate dehydratase PrpD
MTRCLELDDVHEGTDRISMGHGGHVSCMTVPAGLAAAESMAAPVDGKKLITSIAVGGDIIVRDKNGDGHDLMHFYCIIKN